MGYKANYLFIFNIERNKKEYCKNKNKKEIICKIYFVS